MKTPAPELEIFEFHDPHAAESSRQFGVPLAQERGRFV